MRLVAAKTAGESVKSPDEKDLKLIPPVNVRPKSNRQRTVGSENLAEECLCPVRMASKPPNEKDDHVTPIREDKRSEMATCFSP
jgi:hypothetical protein